MIRNTSTRTPFCSPVNILQHPDKELAYGRS